MKLKWTLIGKNGSELPFRKATEAIHHVRGLAKYSDGIEHDFRIRFEGKGDPFLELKDEVRELTYLEGEPVFDIEYADENGEIQKIDGNIMTLLNLKEKEYTILKKTLRFEEWYPGYEADLKAMLISPDKKEKRKMHPNSLANLKHHKQADQMS